MRLNDKSSRKSKAKLISKYRPYYPMGNCGIKNVKYGYNGDYLNVKLPKSVYQPEVNIPYNSSAATNVGSSKESHLSQTLMLSADDIFNMGLEDYVLASIANVGEVSLCYALPGFSSSLHSSGS